MKTFITSILLIIVSFTYGQVSETIEVGFTKSAYLIFDGQKVKYDCGSEDVIVRNNQNILILQAALEDFDETNLFVEVDGKYYVFIIKYKPEPSKYMYNFQKTNSQPVIKQGDTGVVNQDVVDVVDADNEEYYTIKRANYNQESDSILYYKSKSDEITNFNSKIFNRGIRKYKIGLYLRDIAIHDNVFYLKFEYENKSNIGYKLDFLQYKVQGVKRKIKGESQQNIYLKPLYEYAVPLAFEGKSKGTFVIVFDKFALTKNKKLRIEFWEDNGGDLDLEGGRKINFDLFSKDILNVGSF